MRKLYCITFNNNNPIRFRNMLFQFKHATQYKNIIFRIQNPVRIGFLKAFVAKRSIAFQFQNIQG